MEFKRLSDVEVVAEPTETANVLIEENGVIKKAPKTAVGGSGSSEWDAIIEYADIDNTKYVNLISGDCMTVGTKIINGEVPNILIKGTTQYGDFAYGAERAISAYVMGDSVLIKQPVTPMRGRDNQYFTWNKDNTITM